MQQFESGYDSDYMRRLRSHHPDALPQRVNYITPSKETEGDYQQGRVHEETNGDGPSRINGDFYSKPE